MEKASQTYKYAEASTDNIFIQTSDVVRDLFLNNGDGVQEMDTKARDEYILGVLMTQYSLKKGLEAHDQRAEDAVVKELQQIHDMATFSPIKPEDMTKKECTEMVSSLMFLKEK